MPIEKLRHPLVSVIIATFNRAGQISETIDAILNQTFSDIELIVVSDGSTDNTEAVVASFQDTRIMFIQQQTNSGGPSVPRNRGIRESRGKYVAFCDDDDIWLPDKLEKQLRYFDEEGISCVATNYIPDGNVRFAMKSLQIDSNAPFRDLSYEEILLMSNPIILSSVLTRKDILCEAGGFDENPDFQMIEDWELWLRLSQKGIIRILSEHLLYYRMFIKENRDNRHVAMNLIGILEKHRRLGYLNNQLFNKATANCSLVIGRTFLHVNDKRGLGYFCKTLFGGSNIVYRIKAFWGIILLCCPPSMQNFLFRILLHARMKQIIHQFNRF